MYIHIFNEIKNKMNKMFNTNIFMKYQFNRQYRIFNFRKNVVEIFTAVEFYETHPGDSLFNQKSKKEELESSEAENDIDENTSTSQNDSETNNDISDSNIMFKTIIENENASVSIRNEKKKKDLLTSTEKNASKMGDDLSISVKNDLSISVKNDLSISVEIGDLQAENDLQNSIKTDENRTNDLIPQTPSEPAVERSSRRDKKSKKMLFTATNSKFRRKKRTYDSKTFDKKKTPIVNKIIDKIKKSKTYQKTIIGFHKKQ